MLEHPSNPIYLLDGPAPVIFDARVVFLADLYVRKIKKVLSDRQPAYCFFTHTHLDRCDSAAALKKSFPRMRMIASRRSADMLKNPNAIE